MIDINDYVTLYDNTTGQVIRKDAEKNKIWLRLADNKIMDYDLVHVKAINGTIVYPCDLTLTQTL